MPSGLRAAYEFQFADENTIKTRVYYQNDANQIVFELKGSGTHLPGPVDLKPAPTDPKRPPEMRIFDQFIGEWDTAGPMKTKDMPGGFKFTTTAILSLTDTAIAGQGTVGIRTNLGVSVTGFTAN